MKFFTVIFALFIAGCANANESDGIYFQDLRHYYHYDKSAPLQVKHDKENSTDREKVFTFRSHDGETIYATLTKPDNFDTSVSHPLYIGDTNLISEDVIAQRGFIIANISMRLQGKGTHKGLSNSDGSTPFSTVWARLNTVIDYRRLIDYVGANYNIDKRVVIVGGLSRWGRIMTILAATDQRVTGVIAASTSSDWLKTVKTTEHEGFKSTLNQPWFEDRFYQQIMAPIDPKYFTQFLNVPALVLHEVNDKIVTVDGGQRLQKILGDKASMIVYDENAGHGLKTPKVKIDTRKWLDENFFR